MRQWSIIYFIARYVFTFNTVHWPTEISKEECQKAKDSVIKNTMNYDKNR